MLRWTLPLAAALLAAPVGAVTITFDFEGRCTQACDSVLLAAGDAVRGTLAIDDAWLPPSDDLVAFVPNAELLALDLVFGTQRFGLADVVGGDRTLFGRQDGRWFVTNGDGVLASRSGIDLVIGARGGAVPSVFVSLYEGNVPGAAAAGRFVSAVPEPGSAAMALAGLALVGGACGLGRRRHARSL